MMSEWKVSSNPVGGNYIYQVVRIRDTSKVDHSGNREVYACYDTKEEAQDVANRLNAVTDPFTGKVNHYDCPSR